MISGVLGLVETLVYGFDVLKYLIDTRKYLIPIIYNQITYYFIDF